jgi:hypothetical protein
MIANEHFRQHPAIPIWDCGRVKGLPSKRGRNAIHNRLELVLASIPQLATVLLKLKNGALRI